MDIIVWENERQAALWTYELSGQVSDGHWENSRPYNHWERPCYAKVIVGDLITPGPNWIHNRGYNFADKELVGVVGDRMKTIVKFAVAFPQWVAYMSYVDGLDGAVDSVGIKQNIMNSLKWVRDPAVVNGLSNILNADLSAFDMVEYSDADLIKDLRRMTAIWRESRKR